jgi:hypothetical protein
MYPQACSINSSIQRVGRLARAFPFKCRQIPSTGFSSGQATGSQCNSMPNSLASLKLPLAVWGEPRSRNSTMFQPRHWAFRWRRCSWKLSWFQFRAWFKQMAPVLTFKAPYSTPLCRLPMMGTATWVPLGAHLARRGGVSVMMVASVKRTTVRVLPFSPRFSPLLPAASGGLGGPAHSGAASTGSLFLSKNAALWPHSPPHPEWFSDGAAATLKSSPPPSSHTCWGRC